MMGRPELRDAAEGPEGDEEEEDDDEDEQKELEKDLEGGAKPIQPGETAGIYIYIFRLYIYIYRPEFPYQTTIPSV